MTTYYKVLNLDGTSCNGGTGQWSLPRGKRPGKWMASISDIKPCVRGYHLCELQNLLDWIGPAVWVAEGRGVKIVVGNKTVFSQARLVRPTGWNERTARLFACDCAEHVQYIWDKHFPSDKRPAECIVVARRFADGRATQGELAAARAAARDAAWDAARYAAWDARAAAWAAGAAAWAAAWTAARDARDAEKQWQTARLLHYLEMEV